MAAAGVPANALLLLTEMPTGNHNEAYMYCVVLTVDGVVGLRILMIGI